MQEESSRFGIRAVMALALIAVVTSSAHAEKPPLDPLTELVTAESVVDRWFAGRAVFGETPWDFPRQLLQHEDDSVAMTAAWRRVLQTSRQSVDFSQTPEVNLDQAAASRFLGFVEGRLGIETPPAWNDLLDGAKLSEDGWVYVNVTSMKRLFRYNRGLGVWTRKSDLIAREKGRYVIQANGTENVAVPGEFINPQKLISGFLLSSHQTRFILLIPQRVGNYTILCIDRKSGEVQWQQQIWDSIAGGTSGIPLPTFAVPAFSESAVYVFGTSGGASLYVEGFRLKDGKPLVRFSSGY